MNDSEKDVILNDLVMLVRRMVIRLRMAGGSKQNEELADAAMDYLRRKELVSGIDILRSDAEHRDMPSLPGRPSYVVVS